MSKDWKAAWKDRKMERWEREEKKALKKKNHKDNRRAGKEALRDEDYDNFFFKDWEQLGDNK